MNELKQEKPELNFKPKCKSDKAWAYTSKGFLLPCCWCDKRNPNPEKREGWDKFQVEELHIDNVESIEEIISSDVWQEFWRVFEEDPENAPDTCKMYYGQGDKNISYEYAREKNNI
tara:strand:+ start:93 stop:440 length:348 start_codon:yes stop_codon:yes gene_type:complete